MARCSGPISVVVEPRFKTAVLWSGGLRSIRGFPTRPDPLRTARQDSRTDAQRARDFTFPVETSQMPLFRLIGTKRGEAPRCLDGGHVFPFARVQRTRSTGRQISWFFRDEACWYWSTSETPSRPEPRLGQTLAARTCDVAATRAAGMLASACFSSYDPRFASLTLANCSTVVQRVPPHFWLFVG